MTMELPRGGLDIPKGAPELRDEIAQFLKGAVADHGTSMDTGGGVGSADLWVTVGGVEYFIQVKRSKP